MTNTTTATTTTTTTTTTQKEKSIHKLIGEGAFAEVRYFTRNPTTGKDYVMKAAKTEEGKNIIAMEKKLLMTLSHPNIIKAVPCELKKYQQTIIMEKMNCDLLTFVNQRAQRNSYIPEQLLQIIFKKVLSGLAYLHSHGIAHRDIKPENILLGNKKGDVVLCDFGAAFQFSQQTKDTSICGTAAYRAPEIVEKNCKPRVGSAIAKSDIFSLGVTLFVCHSVSLPEEFYNGCQKTRVLKMLQACRVVTNEGNIQKNFPVISHKQIMNPTVSSCSSQASSSMSSEDSSVAPYTSQSEVDGSLNNSKNMHVPAVSEVPRCSNGEGISQDAFSVLSYLLCVDLDERPTAEEILQHCWFQ